MIPLILLPGMMCTSALYKHQIKLFSAERVVHYAPIGGHSDVGNLAAEVLKFAPPEFALCGLSMGGIVAMEVIRQAPRRVSGVALLDTNPFAELDDVKQMRLPQVEKVRNGRLLEVMRDDMIPNYLAESDKNSEILALCSDMALQLGSDVFIQQSLALRDRCDQTETLSAVRVPTLILCGDQDKLCPPERHKKMHEMIPESNLVLVRNAGHLPVLEQPLETNQHLQQWLQSCDLNADHQRDIH